MAHVTLNELLLESFRRFDKPDLLWHKQGGEWKKIPTRTVVAQVVSLAQALQKLGLRKGERGGLLSENRAGGGGGGGGGGGVEVGLQCTVHKHADCIHRRLFFVKAFV